MCSGSSMSVWRPLCWCLPSSMWRPGTPTGGRSCFPPCLPALWACSCRSPSAGRSKRGSISARTFLLTALAWGQHCPPSGALPFMWLGIGYADAVGIVRPYPVSRQRARRCCRVWTGCRRGFSCGALCCNGSAGIGIIVMAIVLLPFLRIGGMQLFQTEASDRSGKDRQPVHGTDPACLDWPMCF